MTIQPVILNEAQHPSLRPPKLDHYINDIRVRSFILTGAPHFSRQNPHKWRGPDLADRWNSRST